MGSYLKFLYFLSLASLITAQPTHLQSTCDSRAIYTNGSIYQANLNNLLSSFSSINDNQLINGFFNSSIGENTDKVNGLFLCRGDVTNEVCKNCVQTATVDIKKNCTNEKEAIIWYYECLLRFSDRSIFSVMEERPRYYVGYENNITGPSRFGSVLTELMSGLVSKASMSSSKFSTGERNLSNSNKILYGLVQCTPDLSASDCKQCLENAIIRVHTCCDSRDGATFIQPSCNIRYDVKSFYNVTVGHLPVSEPSLPPTTLIPTIESPSPSPSTTSTPKNDKGKNSCNFVLIVVISLVSALMLTGETNIFEPSPSLPAITEAKQMQSQGEVEYHKLKNLESCKSTTSNLSE